MQRSGRGIRAALGSLLAAAAMAGCAGTAVSTEPPSFASPSTTTAALSSAGAPDAAEPDRSTEPPAPIICPATLGVAAHPGDLWVPAAPVQRPDRLVSEEVPVRALSCRYHRDGFAEPIEKTGPFAVPLRGDLKIMVGDIRSWPTALPGQGKPCGLVGFSQSDDLLLALTYQSGSTVWIAGQSPGSCSTITNGIGSTFADRSGQLVRSAKAGHWIRFPEWAANCPSGYHCDNENDGRWGQQEKMVPGLPTTVHVTRSNLQSQDHPKKRSGAATEELVNAFNSVPINGSTTGVCSPARGGKWNPTLYTVTFGYASGPTVTIQVTVGCLPSIDNGSLTATGERKVMPLLDRILDR